VGPCGARRRGGGRGCAPPSRRRAHGATWAFLGAVCGSGAAQSDFASRPPQPAWSARSCRFVSVDRYNHVPTASTTDVTLCPAKADDRRRSASQAECRRFESDRALQHSSFTRCRTDGPRASTPTTFLGDSPERSEGRKGG